MGLPQEKSSFSAQEYLAWEEAQIDKHEYLAGEVFAMVGARQDHVIVALNLGSALREHLRGTPCRPLISDMKLNVQAMDAFYYPDVMVTCDEADKVAELYIEHPKLIIEVLSDSTAANRHGAITTTNDASAYASRFPLPPSTSSGQAKPPPHTPPAAGGQSTRAGAGENESLRDFSCIDRGAKFAAYRKIESLEEYVLVDVDRKSVESFHRQPDGRWLLRDFAGAENCVFESVELTMTMARVFEDA